MVEASQLRMVLLQLNKTCCLNTNENLIKAAMEGNTRAVEGLLQCPHADVNTVDIHGWTPLHLASLEGNSDVVEILLNNPQIDVNQGVIGRGETAFGIASEEGDSIIMMQLIMHAKTDFYSGWCKDMWSYYRSYCKIVIGQTDILSSTTMLPGTKMHIKIHVMR